MICTSVFVHGQDFISNLLVLVVSYQSWQDDSTRHRQLVCQEEKRKKKQGWPSLRPVMLCYIKALMAVSSSVNGCKHPVGEL